MDFFGGLFKGRRRRENENTEPQVDLGNGPRRSFDQHHLLLAHAMFRMWDEDPSDVSTWLYRAHPKWFRTIQDSPECIRLLHLADFELPVELTGDPQGLQLSDFDPLRPSVTVPLLDGSKRLPGQFLMMLHDLSHFTRGAIVPLRGEPLARLRDNPMEWPSLKYSEIVGDRDEFVQLVLFDEAEAIFLSDVLLPSLIGFQEVSREVLAGKLPSLGEVFVRSGIVDLSEQRSLLHGIYAGAKLDERLEAHAMLDEGGRRVLHALQRRREFDREATGRRFDDLVRPERLPLLVAKSLASRFSVDLDTGQTQKLNGWPIPEPTLQVHDRSRALVAALLKGSTRRDREYGILVKMGGSQFVPPDFEARQSVVDALERLSSLGNPTPEDLAAVLYKLDTLGMDLPSFGDGPGGFRENVGALHKQAEYPTLGFTVAEDIRFEYPSNHSVSSPNIWREFLSIPDETGSVSRSFVSFVEHGGVPLQLNQVDLWPDARAYGYYPRGERYKDDGHPISARGIVSPLPNFPHALINDVSGGFLGWGIDPSLAGHHAYLKRVWNLGFTRLGMRECSVLRQPLLMSPNRDREALLKAEDLAEVYGGLRPGDVLDGPVVSPYGHQIVEAIVRAAIGPLGPLPWEITGSERAEVTTLVRQRLLEREVAALTISHTAPDRWADDHADIYDSEPLTSSIILAKRHKVAMTPKMIRRVLEGHPAPAVDHPVLSRMFAEWGERGRFLSRLAKAKVDLIESYPFLFRDLLVPLQETVARHIDFREFTGQVAGSSDQLTEFTGGFGAFALSSMSRKTLSPVITYLSIVEKELREAVENDSEWVYGGYIHAKTAADLLGRYREELMGSLPFYDPHQVVDESGLGSFAGRYIQGTQGRVTVDAVVDGGTRLVNRILWNVQAVLASTVDLRHFAGSDLAGWEAAIRGSDPFGSLELMAHAFSRSRCGVSPSLALEPNSIDLTEVRALFDLSPLEVYDRRQSSMWSISHLSAELEHDLYLPARSPLSRVVKGVLGPEIRHVDDEDLTSLGLFPDFSHRTPLVSLGGEYWASSSSK